MKDISVQLEAGNVNYVPKNTYLSSRDVQLKLDVFPNDLKDVLVSIRFNVSCVPKPV